ncbi:MAG: TetR/AcrR family transcriptional regulator [Oscillospiraceae bacterium]|nr:TetR/AcrR family transcriptional regulator [Oscillospiraceae bacterium]
MNVSNNARRKTSVARIENAYLELLQENKREEITVREIAKRAGINRSTFYANYTDISELEEKIKERLLSEFRAIYKEEVRKRSGSNDFLKLFYHIKDNQMLYRAYFRLGSGFSAEDIRYDPVQAEKYFKNKYIDYHIEFFYNGLNAVIKKWLEKGCAETPEEIEFIIKSEYAGRK